MFSGLLDRFVHAFGGTPGFRAVRGKRNSKRRLSRLMPTPAFVVAAFLNAPTHAANVLDGFHQSANKPPSLPAVQSAGKILPDSCLRSAVISEGKHGLHSFIGVESKTGEEKPASNLKPQSKILPFSNKRVAQRCSERAQ